MKIRKASLGISILLTIPFSSLSPPLRSHSKRVIVL